MLNYQRVNGVTKPLRTKKLCRAPLRGKACELVRADPILFGWPGEKPPELCSILGSPWFPTCLWISPSPVIQVSKPSSSKAGRFRTETESLDNLQQRTVHPRASDSQKMDLQWPSTDSTHRIPTSMDSHGQVALTLYFTSLQAQFTTCVTSGCSSNLGYGAMVPKRLHGSMLMWIKHDKTMPYFYHPFSWEC